MLAKSASASVIAAMDSTTTTALGTITGSWRPWISMESGSLSLLWLADGRSWFNVNTENDFASVADTAHDAAGMVGSFDDFSIFDCETIIISRAFQGGYGNAITDFYGFDSSDRH